MNGRSLLTIGAVLGFLTVAMGAFGAHALKDHLSPEMIVVYGKAVHYQGLHTLALLTSGLSARLLTPSRPFLLAGWAFVIGILLFSGSLYILALNGYKTLGIITPFGGAAFLIGWLMLGIAFWKQK